MWTLKPSPIYGVFSTLFLCLLILFLVNKFNSIAYEFGLERMQSHKKNVKIKLKKKKIYGSTYP
jgi:uncharacterized membrane protein